MNHELLIFQMVGGHACSYQKLVPLNFVESQNMGYCYYKLVRISFQRLSKQFRFFCFNLTNESLGNIFKKFFCQKSLLFLFFLQKFQVLNVKCGRSDIELRFCCFNIEEKSRKCVFVEKKSEAKFSAGLL